MGAVWPFLTPDKAAATLKKEHSSEKLTASRIKLPRQAGGGVVTIVWREPNYEDWDAAQAADSRANRGYDGRQPPPRGDADRLAG